MWNANSGNPAKYISIVLQVLLITYLVGPGLNIASYIIDRTYHNPVKWYFPLTYGYHPQPAGDVFGGWGISALVVILYFIYAGIRERVIHTIQKTNPRKSYRIVITNRIAALIVVYLLVPYILATFDIVHSFPFFLFYFAFIPPVSLVCFLNVYWLFPAEGEHDSFTPRLLRRLLLTTFLCTFPFILPSMPFAFAGRIAFLFWLFQLIIVSPISWLFYRQKKDKILQLRGLEKDLGRTTADLQFLRSQINPHFLFNMLNTLYGTAMEGNAEITAESIQKLGDMMRFMLHDNNREFIPLEKEIGYLSNYIELQKLKAKYTPEITIDYKLDDRLCDHMVAPMLLIPFVENAFKHGIDGNKRTLISIQLECDYRSIRLDVKNNKHNRVVNDPEQGYSGIGLVNVRDRLNLLYPNKHELTILDNTKDYSVCLVIYP